MFRISRRLDYGLHLLNTLAQQPDQKLISTAVLSEELDIPLPFLHQIAHTLMQGGFIHAVPGPHGGLRMNRAAEEISVYDIALALEGDIKLSPCSENNDPCPRQEDCATRWIWDSLQSEITQKMQSINLQMLKPAE